MNAGVRCLFFSLLCASHLMAGPPLLTDDPETPGPGAWEINTAVSGERVGGDWSWELPVFDINYGVGDRVQLKYEIPWVVSDLDGAPAEGAAGNSEVGIKWRFLDEEELGFGISVYPQYTFAAPRSSIRRGVVEGGSEFFLPLQAARMIGDTLIYGEVGYVWQSSNDDEWVYGIAAEHELSDWFELVAELHGIAAADFDDDELIVVGGFKWHLTEYSSLIASAGRSLREPEGEPEITVIYLGIQFIF